MNSVDEKIQLTAFYKIENKNKNKKNKKNREIIDVLLLQNID